MAVDGTQVCDTILHLWCLTQLYILPTCEWCSE